MEYSPKTYFLISETVVRTKWKNLRDTFRKELKKMPVKRSGDGASSWSSSWPYFDSMHFLKDQFTARKSTSNLPDDIIFDEGFNSQSSNVEILDRDVDSPSMVDISQNLIDEPLTSMPSTSIPSASSPSVSNFSRKRESGVNECHTPISKKIKRKVTNDLDVGTSLIKLEEEKIKMLGKQKKSDEDECFFESLLPHIRTLSPKRKMLLRMKIQQEVYNCVYGDQQEMTQSTSTFEKTGTQEYSTSSSITSYINHFSDESFHNL